MDKFRIMLSTFRCKIGYGMGTLKTSRAVFDCLLIVITFSIALLFLNDRQLLFTVERPFIRFQHLIDGHFDGVKDDVVVVHIDDRSMASYGRWPWRRSLLAKLINYIAQDKPRAIGIDFLVSYPSQKAEDDSFNNAIDKADNVVLGFHNSLDIYPFNYNERYSGRLDYRIGFLDIVRDKSGRSIGVQPFLKKQNIIVLPFALSLLVDADEGLIDKAIKADELIRLNYYKPEQFIHYSAADILGNNIHAPMEGKIVIIGANFAPSGQETPYGRLSNTEFEANIVRNMIEDNWLRFDITLSMAVILIGGILFYVLTLMRKLLLRLAMVVICLALMSYLLHRGIIVSSPIFIISILFSYILTLYRRRESNIDQTHKTV